MSAFKFVGSNSAGRRNGRDYLKYRTKHQGEFVTSMYKEPEPEITDADVTRHQSLIEALAKIDVSDVGKRPRKKKADLAPTSPIVGTFEDGA